MLTQGLQHKGKKQTNKQKSLDKKQLNYTKLSKKKKFTVSRLFSVQQKIVLFLTERQMLLHVESYSPLPPPSFL